MLFAVITDSITTSTTDFLPSPHPRLWIPGINWAEREGNSPIYRAAYMICGTVLLLRRLIYDVVAWFLDFATKFVFTLQTERIGLRNLLMAEPQRMTAATFCLVRPVAHIRVSERSEYAG
jgi:hypothetical protein